MSKFAMILGALLLAAALIVPAALANDGRGLADDSLRERVERIRKEADAIMERVHVRLDRGDRPFDRFSAETIDGMAIAVGRVESITDSSITVDGRSFTIDDRTSIPPELESGDFVVANGDHLATSLTVRK